MRISDWSSDVCSSDLKGLSRLPEPNNGPPSARMAGLFLTAGNGGFRPEAGKPHYQSRSCRAKSRHREGARFDGCLDFARHERKLGNGLNPPQSRPSASRLNDVDISGDKPGINRGSAVETAPDRGDLGVEFAVGDAQRLDRADGVNHRRMVAPAKAARSEEHTSELQSLLRSSYAVIC